MGVKPNLSAVMCIAEVSLRAYFENAVEVPQQNAAPTANKAAINVPEPVEKFTLRLGKDTKYPATKATADKPKNRLPRGSRSKIAEAEIAKIGLSCCNNTTTENGMNCILPSAAVYRIVPTAPDRKDTPMIAVHCFWVSFLKALSDEIMNGNKTTNPKTCSQKTITGAGKLYSCLRSRPSKLHKSAAKTTATEPYLIYFILVPLSAAFATSRIIEIPTIRSAHDFHMIIPRVGGSTAIRPIGELHATQGINL